MSRCNLQECTHTQYNTIGNHTYASVKGPEDYDFLKASFEPVWEEVGEVISNPVVEIREHHYTLDIVFGSDYKVLYNACQCAFIL